MTREQVVKLTDMFLEGRALPELTVFVNEAVVDATDVESFVKGPAYKNLHKAAMELLRIVECDTLPGLMDELGLTPDKAMEEALEYIFYVRSFLQGLKLQNFPAEVQTVLAKNITTLKRSEDTGNNELDKFARDPSHKLKPIEWARRPLDAIMKVFSAMGIPWDVDHTWQNYIKNDGDKDKNNPAIKRDASGRRKIDYSVPEGRRGR